MSYFFNAFLITFGVLVAVWVFLVLNYIFLCALKYNAKKEEKTDVKS